jgi:hypothetical protein
LKTTVERNIGRLAALLLGAAAVALPVRAHHSFTIYNDAVTKVFTGVVVRVSPDVNHLQIFFAPMNEARNGPLETDADGKPVIWAVEMGGSAQMARDGVTVNAFPARDTIISVGLHPLRSGDPAGSLVGGLFKCPPRTPPSAGKHCDAVEGHTQHGRGALAAEPAETE